MSLNKVKMKLCANAFCQMEIHSGRSDKKFCSPKCKSSHHNREIKVQNQTIYVREKELRTNEKLLKALFHTKRYQSDPVPRIILDDRGIQLLIYSHLEVNTRTGKKILWSYRYGLEDAGNQKFSIHHRTKI